MRYFWVIVELWSYRNYGQFHVVDIALRSKVLQQNWLQILSEINWTNQIICNKSTGDPYSLPSKSSCELVIFICYKSKSCCCRHYPKVNHSVKWYLCNLNSCELQKVWRKLKQCLHLVLIEVQNDIDRLLNIALYLILLFKFLCCGHYPPDVVDITFSGRYRNLHTWAFLLNIKPCRIKSRCKIMYLGSTNSLKWDQWWIKHILWKAGNTCCWVCTEEL